MTDIAVFKTDELSREAGSSIVEVALILPLFVFLLLAAFDFGRTYIAALGNASAAQAGALYGVQHPKDVAGMIAAAKLDGTNEPSLVATASYGCSCSDGSSEMIGCASAPTCSYNIVNYVEVSTVTVYTPLFHYPGIPDHFTLTDKVRMRSAH